MSLKRKLINLLTQVRVPSIQLSDLIIKNKTKERSSRVVSEIYIQKEIAVTQNVYKDLTRAKPSDEVTDDSTSSEQSGTETVM